MARDLKGHGEYSGGPGLTDPEARAVGPEKGAVPPEVALWEIYATETTKVEDLGAVKLERPDGVGAEFQSPGASGV